MGKRKLGIRISRALTVGVILLALTFIFDDFLFFKWNAKKHLREQGIELNDSFKILNNESGGIRDYYHKFELQISDSDKKKLIEQIKSAENFTDTVSTYFYLPENKNRYSGEAITVNYENLGEFKTEYYKPNGQGIAPTYRIISISKTENKLTFEDIID
ncbi:hypothetical protein [Flagellimonas sp. S3867]|uniref:hypothetical protein n=1 Tax=Flagellimonas sp. S3867 TaxID=2768063 RepID=UPI0016869E88|nr:hypothetical protein [Flagellimonas sp. S3867]